LSSVSFSHGMQISVTGLSWAIIFAESADNKIKRVLIEFFIGESFTCLIKVKVCYRRNQEKVEWLNEAIS